MDSHMSEREIEQTRESIEAKLAQAEPRVEVLALERAGNESLRLFIDHPDGVDLALCERVTKDLRELLVDWSLEVSSPGPERPLTKPEHFRRFLGHTVRVKTTAEIRGRRSFTGRLTGADDEQVSVETSEDGITIPLAQVRRSNLIPEEEVAT
jgi:ribosome maturation factor RimP